MNLVDVTLHGILGKQVGQTWKLAVASVGEAMRAIEMNSKKKLYKTLLNLDKQGIKYEVLINSRPFLTEKRVSVDEPSTISQSELAANILDLRTIDIVPVIEAADDGGLLSIIAGVILVIVGIILIATPFGVPLIVAGVGLIAAGVTALLMSPPDIDNFREIEGGGGTSYLFNGPQNVTREGGPVPVGYGRLLVGSQVISASYEIYDVETE